MSGEDLNDDDFSGEIADLEARIEVLSESIERCRKFSLAARLAIAAGAAWLALLILGLVTFAPYELVAALAAVLGGIVLLGSNATTWAQAQETLEQAEATRGNLIGQMDLRLVSAPKPTFH